MASSDAMELLFFDTFSHENSDECNLDLVQFPKAVQICEVRVIPLGTRVQADFPGGVRLGATNPSQFHVDFFVNDLSKPGASTFHQIGSLDYKHNVEIQLCCSAKVPTDGLVLQGFYTTITLAIFGNLTKVLKEQRISTPPPPPPVVQASNKPKTTPSVAETDSRGEDSITDEWQQEVASDSTPISTTITKRGKTPEPPQQFPIPTYHSQHSDYEHRWTNPEVAVPLVQEHLISRSGHDYAPGAVGSSSNEAGHRRRGDEKSSKVRDNRDERRDSRSSGGLSRERDRDRGRDRERERERDRDRDVRQDRFRPEKVIRTPPGTPVRKHPPSPKERRPRTPTSPHPSELESLPKSKPASPADTTEHDPVDSVEDVPNKASQYEIFEPLTPEVSPSEHLEMLSDCEVQEAGYADYYEEIVSDEEEMSGSEDRILDGEMEYDLGDDTYAPPFNPFQCEFSPLVYFRDASFTPFEMEMRKKVCTTTSSEDTAMHKLLNLIEQGREKKPSEKWVEVLEVIPNYLVPAASALKEPNMEYVFDLLIDWCCDALDFNLAFQQQQAVFKVRHMKGGIRLATALFSCHRQIVRKVLEKDVQRRLLKLYVQDYMALSLKLLILKALDSSTRSKEGMKAFLGTEHDTEDSAYQMLLAILLSKQMTRATVGIMALLRKVYFYQVLESLHTMAEGIPLQFPAVFKRVDSSKQSEAASSPLVEGEEHENLMPQFKIWSESRKEDLKTILSCLQEVHNVYIAAPEIIAHPRRFLPVEVQFAFQRNSDSAFCNIYGLFNECSFLEVLLILLTFPPTALQPTIIAIIKDILNDMLVMQHGQLFLLSHTETCNGIVRLLNSEEGRDDVADELTLQQLGQQMVHVLHALQCVDALLAENAAKGERCKEIDEPEVLSTLHDLYTMTFTPLGRSAVISVLASERNLQAILPFVQFVSEEEYDVKLRKSACIGYATELLLMTVRMSENVELLQTFSEKLLSISSQELAPKIQELSSWLAPTRKLPSYDYQAIPYLCAIVKSSMEDVISFPGELITTLRILHFISIPASQSSAKENRIVELKYKYVAAQLFANDALSCFLAILQKICDAHLYPSLHASGLVGQKGALLIAVVKPTVSMTMRILSYLIQSRNNEFKDLTSIPVLMRLHSLLSCFPTTSAHISTVQMACVINLIVHLRKLVIQCDIIDTLLAFTQPVLSVSESEEALSCSLWTKMLQELFKFVLMAPHTFVSSMTVLSELLPLPFPLHSHEPLTSNEITRAVNYRKLWSAHLHCLSPTIQDIIQTLGGAGDQTLQQLVRRVCVQLADLFAPTALVVVRGVVDAVLECLPEDSAKDPSQLSHLARFLNLLSFLTSHACIKAPLLYLIRGSSKLDKKYGEALTEIATLFSSLPTQGQADKLACWHQIQECVMSIFQSFCDTEITLISSETQMSALDQLANSLPCKEQLSTICVALWEHLATGTPGIPSVLIALRTLVMLTEHDYGIYHIKSTLDKCPTVLYAFLNALCKHFVKDNPDYLSTLSTFLELLQLMVNAGEAEDENVQVPVRTLEISPAELAQYLNWENPQKVKLKNEETVTSAKKDSEQEQNAPSPSSAAVTSSDASTQKIHPVLQLEKLLSGANRDDYALEVQVLENIHCLVQLLNDGANSPPTEKPMQEVILPAAEKLSLQFNHRLPYIIADIDEDGLSTSFWLSQPSTGDDSDQENEQVNCDLQALADQFCPGLDFSSELGKMFLAKDDSINGEKSQKSSSSGLAKRKYQPLINPGSKEPARKKTFIAPMRGRGYSRGMLHSSRANDPFRSRPPNTSRPPSMHVDDFVAMEIFQPSSASSGQSSKRPNKEISRGRGRGSGAGGSGGGGSGGSGGGGAFENARDFNTNRGRFLNPSTPNYSRREDRGRGGSRGGQRMSPNSWNSRNATPISLPSKSAQKFGSGPLRSYTRGGHTEPRSSESRPSTGRLLDTPGSRFIRTGIRGIADSSGGSGLSSIWQNLRAKDRDSRFSTPSHQLRGRRDSNRHARSFTR